ncbi:hypothetical protein BHE74_00042998 [Ensete ventricosum]|nr:hypothetical protein BHE74_00042998 [Ensete ventricosum]
MTPLCFLTWIWCGQYSIGSSPATCDIKTWPHSKHHPHNDTHAIRSATGKRAVLGGSKRWIVTQKCHIPHGNDSFGELTSAVVSRHRPKGKPPVLHMSHLVFTVTNDRGLDRPSSSAAPSIIANKLISIAISTPSSPVDRHRLTSSHHEFPISYFYCIFQTIADLHRVPAPPLSAHCTLLLPSFCFRPWHLYLLDSHSLHSKPDTEFQFHNHLSLSSLCQ